MSPSAMANPACAWDQFEVTRTAELYAAVFANPADDGPREVLADHLHELGDPRGEFIALQLAKLRRKPTAVATRRERSLLADHHLTWLGALADAVNPPNSTWVRGFLDTAWVDLSSEPPADPMWNTVRSIRRIGALTRRPPSMFGAGCFAALAELHGIELEHLAPIVDAVRKPPLEVLKIESTHGRASWTARERTLLDRLVELPRLTRVKLAFSQTELDVILRSEIARRLTHLELAPPVIDLPRNLAAAESLENLVELALSTPYYEFRFARGTDNRLSALTIVWTGLVNAASYLTRITTPMRALPEDTLTSFRFDHASTRFPAPKLKPLMNAVARQRRIPVRK
jgi:uncharacterized protein (TIGR02996 family)